MVKSVFENTPHLGRAVLRRRPNIKTAWFNDFVPRLGRRRNAALPKGNCSVAGSDDISIDLPALFWHTPHVIESKRLCVAFGHST